MRKQKGFSLIELLIVIAIILIIAAIAIPSLMRSRMLANQSAAAQTIRTLITAQTTYLNTYGVAIGYSPNILSLGNPGPRSEEHTSELQSLSLHDALPIFSLIELLIVIAIILIIAAIAIPSLMRSRMLANQSAAAQTIRTLITAQTTYLNTYGVAIGYSPNILSLGNPGP